MKNAEEFRMEFPETEEEFKDRVYQTLQSVHEEKRRNGMKLKPIIMVAVILVVMMSVGVAATVEKWSMFESVPDSWMTANEEDVSRMKASFTPIHLKGNGVDATLREAIYDGYGLYLVVDMRPKSPDVFLLPRDNAELTSPAGDVVSSFPYDVTLEKHIKDLGYQTIYRIDMSAMLSNCMVYPATVEMNEDGSFTFFLRVRLMDEKDILQPEIKTDLSIVIQRNESWNTDYISTDLSISAQPVLAAKVSAPDESHVFANCGVRLSNVRLYRTLLTTYLMADVEIVDQQVYDDHYLKYLFYSTDKDGNRLDSGYFNVSGITQDRSTGTYTFNCTLSLKELPDTLGFAEATWRIGIEKEVVDQWIFPLVDMK